ncbi:hypothetical protein ACFQ3P_21740 [Paraburkholderia sabiae]|jgi:hypothetical protein|uniref:Uncharacterized protein n=1 Tax=Paraburkholderia sabiae TaxID=273251 RepID=A0ABU9QBU5_9BURK|nr:hypothetical protein [Paraburkholderia sabiae]WJZ76920.1 hypothetical protein QEN71_14345 [Paraburkholderia sabiae]CAD6542939.1 hypothetical protein LMG24235_03839 [Paraburkholderia sabiae]
MKAHPREEDAGCRRASGFLSLVDERGVIHFWSRYFVYLNKVSEILKVKFCALFCGVKRLAGNAM